jgi:hypothetical protein
MTTNQTQRAKRISKAQVVERWRKLNPDKTPAQATLDSVASAWWDIREEDPTESKTVASNTYYQPSESWLQEVEDML